MFQVGALIVYGSTGVCRVEDVRKMDPNGENRERLYYILRPLFQDCTISISEVPQYIGARIGARPGSAEA